MDSSRVYIRGLPPSFTEEEFRAHFSKRYAVTDIKLLPQRRIGYVGFRSPQDAASVVKYFNKSFIRMSRIVVEPAHPAIFKTRTTTSTTENATVKLVKNGQHNASLKRKRGHDLEEQNQPQRSHVKLDQSPGTVGSTAKAGRAVQREHTIHNDGTAISVTQSNMANTFDEMVEGLLPATKDGTEIRTINTVPAFVELQALLNACDNDQPGDKTSSEQPDVQAPEGQTSDGDWMRLRTSRLLGLNETDDEGETSDEKHARAPAASARPQVANANTSVREIDVPPADMTHVSVGESDTGPSVAEVSDGNTDLESEAIRKSGRLFLRNLSYTVTVDDVRKFFETAGKLQEVSVPVDPKTNNAKGFAFVQFQDVEQAVKAYIEFDGVVFQGRLLHILPAAHKRDTPVDDFAISQLPLKKQKQILKQAEASSRSFSWNCMYMNADAVMSSISDRLGVAKSELLDPTSSDAAVKQAQAETHVIQETKAFFEANGVDLNSLKSHDRGDQAILVKNFPYGTTTEDLRKLFEEYGEVARLLMPPSGTIAIVELANSAQGRIAFNSLSYRKYKDSVLFLEKAPNSIFRSVLQAGQGVQSLVNAHPQPSKLSTTDLVQENVVEDVGNTSTLFVRNLNFSTTTKTLYEAFKPLNGLLSARVKTKPNLKVPGQVLSMGFGFLEFRTSDQARAAMAAMNGYNLDGHQLLIKVSHKGQDAAEERREEKKAKSRKERKSKIIVKNLPFEASKKDVQTLFKSYGQLRGVRLPRKFDNSRKGFAFAEFTTPTEAENAMNALRDSHLYGRRLVLEFAKGEDEDPEREIEKMQQKVGQQSNSIVLQRLATSTRKKFRVGESTDDI